MDINKDVCIECVKRDNCDTREEIHSDNFTVSECDNIEKNSLVGKEKIKKGLECCNSIDDEQACPTCPYFDPGTFLCVSTLMQDIAKLITEQEKEIIRLKYKDDCFTKYCDSTEKCWAKSEEGVCRTIENCPYKISKVEYMLKEIK